MGLAAKLFRHSEGEQRSADRVPADLGATIRDDSAAPIDATIHDLSTSGFLAESSADLRVDSLIRVGLSGLGSASARVVWKEGDLYGCAFMQQITHTEVKRALIGNTVEHLSLDSAAPRPAAVAASNQAAGASASNTYSTEAYADPIFEKWPIGQRVLAIVGSSAILWACIWKAGAALWS